MPDHSIFGLGPSGSGKDSTFNNSPCANLTGMSKDDTRDVQFASSERTTDAEVTAFENKAVSVPSTTTITLDDNEDPRKMSILKKYFIILVLFTSAMCATCASSIASATEPGLQRDLHISHEVAILGISLYVLGLGSGPLFLGPLSEFYGRNIVYQLSYSIFLLFQFPVAFAKNAGVYMAFRFLSGVSAAALLCVAGGSVVDIFDDASVSNPMAVYTLAPFLGPVVGPAYSGLINQHINWRRTYQVTIVWSFINLIALLFIPETYAPVLLRRKAANMLHKESGEVNLPADAIPQRGVLYSALINTYRPFQIIYHERMAFLLDFWNSLVLGVLYLTFQAFPIIFGQIHHFNVQSTGLSFSGIGIGMLIGLFTQFVYWNKVVQKHAAMNGGESPPEVRLLIGMAGAVLTPISLFWLAFTTYPHVHWVVPMLSTVLLGISVLYTFTAVFTFLVTAYQPHAASAMAGNSFMRSCFAAAFPLFTAAMYNRLGTVGATALIAGLTTLMVPLPFIFYKYGPQLRQSSKFAER